MEMIQPTDISAALTASGQPEKYLSFKVGFHKVSQSVCRSVTIKRYLKDTTISLKENNICDFCKHFVEDCMSHLLILAGFIMGPAPVILLMLKTF